MKTDEELMKSQENKEEEARSFGEGSVQQNNFLLAAPLAQPPLITQLWTLCSPLVSPVPSLFA